MANSTAFEPKSIMLMSRWPFIDNYKEILKQIYRISMSVNSVPLERIIWNLIQELPLPDQGVTMIEYTIGNSTLWFSRPPPKYFSLWPDSSYEYLFRALKIEDVILLLTWVMLEKKVLLVSKKKSLLSNVSRAILALLFPFKWEHVLIPILPKQLLHCIETIFPYIIGVSPDMLA